MLIVKNKIYTYAPAALDASVTTEIHLDLSLTLTQTTEFGGVENFILYPQQLRIQNDSGVTINWNIISTPSEYEEYTSASPPTYYQLLPVLTDKAIVSPNSNKIYKLIIQAATAGATGNLTVFAINYI